MPNSRTNVNKSQRPRSANSPGGTSTTPIFRALNTSSNVSAGKINQSKKITPNIDVKYSDFNNNNNSKNNLRQQGNVTPRKESRDLSGKMSAQTSKSEIQSLFNSKRVHPALQNTIASNKIWKNYRPMTSPSNIGRSSVEDNLTTKEILPPPIQVPDLSSSQNESTSSISTILNSTSSGGFQIANGSSIMSISSRPSTIDETLKCPLELVSCLKNCKLHREERNGNSVSSRQNVTFAPDTMDIERENKPKKIKAPKNNRRPKFAHPCCGHFLPPQIECCNLVGPDGACLDNPYTKYTFVWDNPANRNSPETDSKWKMRLKRFRKLLADLSAAHQKYNSISENRKSNLMITEIIPRYIMALDIALMDSDLMHTEQLIVTITSTIRILQVHLHDLFFEADGKPKDIPKVSSDGCDFLSELGPVIFALNRLAFGHNRYDVGFLALEPALVKLQLELVSLTLCPIRSLMFRCVVSVVPNTAAHILELLADIREQKDPEYYVKWVNNSVCHRDYMAILKEFRLCDEIGASDKLPPPKKVPPNNMGLFELRPSSADPAFQKSRY